MHDLVALMNRLFRKGQWIAEKETDDSCFCTCIWCYLLNTMTSRCKKRKAVLCFFHKRHSHSDHPPFFAFIQIEKFHAKFAQFLCQTFLLVWKGLYLDEGSDIQCCHGWWWIISECRIVPKQNQVPGSHAIICDLHIVNNLSESFCHFICAFSVLP